MWTKKNMFVFFFLNIFSFFTKITICADQREQDVGGCPVPLQGQTEGPGFHPRPDSQAWAELEASVAGPSPHLHPGGLVLGL